MKPMQKVNTFIEQPDGSTSYRTGAFPRNSTVKEILRFYGLSDVGVSAYMNGEKVELLRKLSGSDSTCFLSFIYGELKETKKTSSKLRSLSPTGT